MERSDYCRMQKHMEWQSLVISRLFTVRRKKYAHLGCELSCCKEDIRCIALSEAPISIHEVRRESIMRNLDTEVWVVDRVQWKWKQVFFNCHFSMQSLQRMSGSCLCFRWLEILSYCCSWSQCHLKCLKIKSKKKYKLACRPNSRVRKEI